MVNNVVAITACAAGIAHTYMAAEALEQAGKDHNINIKVETQGADGINNRITSLDIKNAKLVIFAHDVAIKEPLRFTGKQILDITTKEAMYNAEVLLKSNKA